MTMQQLRSIVNDTPANAIDVSWNFGTIENQINTSLIDRDGTVAMTGQLTLLGAPTQALHAAPKEYVDAAQPVGMIVDYGGTAAPSGWLLCEGAIVNQSSYPLLFAVVGTAFNTGGEGGTQFRLPDFRSRSAVHPSAVQVRGATGGNADLKAHSHTQNSHIHTMGTHTHTMNHNHPSATTNSDTHNHTLLANGIAADYVDIPNYAMFRNLAAGSDFYGALGQNRIDFPTTATDEHSHSLDLPSYSGNTGPIDPGDTNSATATNNSTGAGTDNYHPYLLVKKIIKAA